MSQGRTRCNSNTSISVATFYSRLYYVSNTLHDVDNTCLTRIYVAHVLHFVVLLPPFHIPLMYTTASDLMALTLLLLQPQQYATVRIGIIQALKYLALRLQHV